MNQSTNELGGTTDLRVQTDLVQQIERCERNANEVIDRLRDKERKAIALGAQLVAEEQRVAQLELQLAEKELELARITNTLGWRLLSYYGPIKYRFVLPAYRRLQKLFMVKTS